MPEQWSRSDGAVEPRAALYRGTAKRVAVPAVGGLVVAAILTSYLEDALEGLESLVAGLIFLGLAVLGVWFLALLASLWRQWPWAPGWAIGTFSAISLLSAGEMVRRLVTYPSTEESVFGLLITGAVVGAFVVAIVWSRHGGNDVRKSPHDPY